MLPGENQGEYGDVSVGHAKELIERNPSLVILDVRTNEEYRNGHIEGALNIPVDELEERLDELDDNDELLVYCRTGNRSRTAIEILNENGYEKVHHMNEGITAWIASGYPITK
jgi:rhodanese-related sulfurtransferase